MDASDILHVVLEQNGVHTLYAKSGDVILFNPESGTVLSVTRLPSDAEVEKVRKSPVTPSAPGHTLRL
jgi:hypothetical protein